MAGAVRKWIRRVWVVFGLGFTAWLFWNAQAHDVNAGQRQSSPSVVVLDSSSTIAFIPRHDTDAPGLIFLPGGAIDPWAYAPLVRMVAEAGYPAVIVRLPWRSAPTRAGQEEVWRRIEGVSTRYPGRRWILAGHSRGAALAARIAGEHPGSIAGLALIGTTHPKTASLAGLALPVTKVYGTNDCVADSASVMAGSALLPPSTNWVRIAGGNHRQFGSYGTQLGDCDATITRDEQQSHTAGVLREMLASLQRH
jgi:predicted esterase